MKIAKEKDKPDTREGTIPEGVFPYQMPAIVQKALYKNTKNRIRNGPEPPVRYSENFFLSVF
jgi:hypothetical protein